MKQLIDFYKKNRLVILGALALIIALQWCHNRSETLYKSNGVTATEEVFTVPPDRIVDHPDHNEPDSNEKPGYNPWISYLIMVGLVLFVFVAQRRGWIEKLIPGMVLVRIHVRRNRSTKRRMLQLYLLNTTKSGQTFDAPMVEFLKPGSVKSYRINVNNNSYSFPITLTNNTSHKIVIDLDQFYEKLAELKSYRWVRVKVMINGVRVKKTLPRWVI